MGKLLLEIGTEEIPSSYIRKAANDLRSIAAKKLVDAMLEPEERPGASIITFATPRRLAMLVEEVPEKQQKRTNKVNGPPQKAAFDNEGKPTKAGLGFAKKYGKQIGDLQIEDTPKGEYTYLEIEEGGENSADVLKKILPEIISAIAFPKTMRWGSGETRFTRPIRSVLALLGGETIKFSMEGLKSGNTTFGHRFASNGAVTIKTPDSYETSLKSASVIVDPEKRKAIIIKSLEEAGNKTGSSAVPDEELVETVCFLTENPVAVTGSFDNKYLDLPRELLITVMKHHQRYFAMENARGTLANSFVAFSNIDCADLSVVRKGYERVLEARLSDARFFFDEDQKHKLEHFAEKLSSVVYQKGLGTMADKTDRIKSIAAQIADAICPDEKSSVETAANLCKADLTTSMVYEFPELQGIMGREYAKAQGMDDEIAQAIDEHYKPRFSGDELPSGNVATAVALADKIDTICGTFALGHIPTGSEDPFSLRRHAIGIVRILLTDYGNNLTLYKLIGKGVSSLPNDVVKDVEKVYDNIDAFFKANITPFFNARITSDFQSRGLSFDVIDAIVEAYPDYYLPDALKRCEALAEMKKEDYCENLSISFKRAKNIVKEHFSTDIDESLLEEAVEKELMASLKKREENLAPLIESKDYERALKEIAEIRSAVDYFFDGVMVMADDNKLKENRLSILRRVVNLFEKVADFSKLVY